MSNPEKFEPNFDHDSEEIEGNAKEELEEKQETLESEEGLIEKIQSAKEILSSFIKKIKERIPSKRDMFLGAMAISVLVSNGVFADAMKAGKYNQERDVWGPMTERAQVLTQEDLNELKGEFENKGIVIFGPEDLGEVTIEEESMFVGQPKEMFLAQQQEAAVEVTEATIDDSEMHGEYVEKSKEEQEIREFNPQMRIVDIGFPSTEQDVSTDEFSLIDGYAQKLLGDEYITQGQIVKEFGEDFDEKWEAIIDKHPQALLNNFLAEYARHGETVEGVMDKAWEKAGLEGTDIERSSLRNIFDATSIDAIEDDLGNQGFSLDFDSERIIDLLKDDESKVINLSFQVGDVQVFWEKFEEKLPQDFKSKYERSFPEDLEGKIYIDATPTFTNEGIKYLDVNGNDVKPTTKEELEALKQKEAEKSMEIASVENPRMLIIGAYTKEKAEQNLSELFDVAKAYPDKLFVVAAGNEGEDMRDALEELSFERPDNLIIVAEWASGSWGGGLPEGGVHGADMYVNNWNLKIDHGSSFSAPVIAAHASVLFDQGLSKNEVVEQLTAECRFENYNIPQDGTEEKVCVFDYEKETLNN